MMNQLSGKIIRSGRLTGHFDGYVPAKKKPISSNSAMDNGPSNREDEIWMRAAIKV